MKDYMYKTKWVVYNENYEKIRTVTLKHKDGGLYKEIEPFEKELKDKCLMAVQTELLEQTYLKGKSFKDKLIALGYA